MAQQHFSPDMPQSSTYVRGCKPRPKPDIGFMCIYSLCQILVVGPWSKSHTWRLGMIVIRIAGSPLGIHLLVLQTLERRRMVGDGVPDVL